LILALVAGAAVVGVFAIGWWCGSDAALTMSARLNFDAMEILGVDWARYIEALRKVRPR